MTKFLTICEGGNVRSVSLAFVLKYEHGQDAIAISHAKTGDEAFRILSNWADYIVAMQPQFVERIPKRNKKKIRVVDVGPDRWMNPLHPELLGHLSPIVQDWATRQFKI